MTSDDAQAGPGFGTRAAIYDWAPVIAVWIVLMAILFVRCGTNPNFWFDEAGQFWMSRGQIHYSPPLTPNGTLVEVLQANRTANMDPGGYTVALHWWMLAGTSPGWLRSFSFIFFAVTMGAFAALCRLWAGNRTLALPAGLLPAAAPLLTRYALELRPYSMEACGVAVALLLLEYLSRNQTPLRALVLGGTVALFLTSRYGFICIAVAVGLAVLWQVRRLERRPALAVVAAYAIPVALSCAAIYFITLRHPGSHQKADPGPYVQDFIMHGKPFAEQLAIAAKGFFPHGIGALALIAVYLLFALRRNAASRYQTFTLLAIVVAATTAEFFIFSLIGMYPWCPQCRWGIAVNVLSLLSWLPVLWMICGAAGARWAEGRWHLPLALLIAVGALYNVSTTTLYTTDRILANVMALGPETLRSKYVFVEAPAQASLRYLYEFGPLKPYAPGVYPENFRFEIPANFNEGSRPFDYFISSEAIRKGEFSR